MRRLALPPLLVLLLASGCSRDQPAPAQPPPARPAPAPSPAAPAAAEPGASGFDASEWGRLLSAYATDDGGFRYEALRGDEASVARLRAVVAAIAAASPDGWSREQRLAFFINAYNALTVHSVLELWPVTSVMQEEGFFRERRHRVAGREVTLDQLENEIIRGEEFAEPRIHFAVNCASVGCPPLAREPYTAEHLEQQLAASTRAYLRASTRRSEDGSTVTISKLFEWFEGDFAARGGVRAFIARHLEEGDLAAAVRNESTTLVHAEYDWALNGR